MKNKGDQNVEEIIILHIKKMLGHSIRFQFFNNPRTIKKYTEFPYRV